MHAAPIHPSDMGFCRGYYGEKSKLKSICGCGGEGAGEIVEVGPGVDASYIGKRVAVFQDIYSPDHQGTYRQYVYDFIDNLIIFPDDVDYELISTATTNPVTICGFIDYCHKNKHTSIINDAAYSACGRLLVRLCKHFDIKLINIVRKDEQIESLKNEYGADIVLNFSTDEFPDELAKAIEKNSPTCYFTSIAGELASYVLNQMQNNSTMVVYGALSMEKISYSGLDLIFRGHTITNFWALVSKPLLSSILA